MQPLHQLMSSIGQKKLAFFALITHTLLSPNSQKNCFRILLLIFSTTLFIFQTAITWT